MDAAKRLLMGSDDQPLPLTPKAFDTSALPGEERPGNARERRIDEVALARYRVEENNLSQNISILRRVLGESRAQHRYIITVPGRGYRLVAEVQTREMSGQTKMAPRIKAIAILPFKPLVSENQDLAMELGMADTLIAQLSGREMIVRPLSSVRKYVELDHDPLIAGQETMFEKLEA